MIFVSDHGGGGANFYDHGSDLPLDLTIFWGCSGPGIAPGILIHGDLVITDTAAVVIDALGLKAPATWEAKLQLGLFSR